MNYLLSEQLQNPTNRLNEKMKKIAALTLVIGTSSHAGFGGMGNVEEGSSGDLSDMVWGALIIGAIYLAWKKFF